MNYTSRRSFLSSLAILSAGATIASAPGFLQIEKQGSELQQLWTNFWKLNGGRRITRNLSLMQEATPVACKGHTYKIGEPIHFADKKLLAVPAWVYWSNNQHKPADLIITFFKDEDQPIKIICINRFELEGLSSLLTSGGENKILPALFKASASADAASLMNIKTSITNNRAEVLGTFSNQPVCLRTNLFYNI